MILSKMRLQGLPARGQQGEIKVRWLASLAACREVLMQDHPV